MAERYEHYHKEAMKLPFNLFLPDGSAVMGVNPKTKEKKPIIDRLTLDEKKRLEGMGYTVKLVENKRKAGIELSQTRHDKGEDE